MDSSITEKFISFWKRNWGKVLSEEEHQQVFYTGSYTFYERRQIYLKYKRKIFLKRLFMIFAAYLIFMTALIIVESCVDEVIYNFQNIPSVACHNQILCSYFGPKTSYEHTSETKGIKLKNGDIFIYHDNAYTKLILPNPVACCIAALIETYHQSCISYIKNKIDSGHLIQKGRMAEIYSHFWKKFRPVTIDRGYIGRGSHLKIFDLIERSDGKILVIDSAIPLQLYDPKHNVYTDFGDNLFNQENGKKRRFNYITHFNNKMLIQRYLTGELYLYDIDTKETLEGPVPLLLFADPEKRRYSVFKKFKNGKILFLVKDYSYDNNDNIKIIDQHFELYDIAQNKFVAQYKYDYFKDNIFIYEHQNGDMEFLNEDITYIISNEDNKIYIADNYTLIKNENSLKDLMSKIENLFDLDMSKLRKTEMGNGRYLLTCGDYLEGNISLIKQKCSNIIFFDEETGRYITEKSFDYFDERGVVKLEENKVMFIGGVLRVDDDTYSYISDSRVQIYEFKGWRNN